jgi:hypothetical protein
LPFKNLAALAGREVALYAKRKVRVRGYRSIVGSQFAEGAPHPSPLRASFARLDPVKSGEREL